MGRRKNSRPVYIVRSTSPRIVTALDNQALENLNAEAILDEMDKNRLMRTSFYERFLPGSNVNNYNHDDTEAENAVWNLGDISEYKCERLNA